MRPSARGASRRRRHRRRRRRPVTRLITRWTVGMPRSRASRAADAATPTPLYVGSVTTTAWPNPRASARPKCSTPAWVSSTIASPRRRPTARIVCGEQGVLGAEAAAAGPGQRAHREEADAVRCALPERSTTSSTSGLSRISGPNPRRAGRRSSRRCSRGGARAGRACSASSRGIPSAAARLSCASASTASTRRPSRARSRARAAVSVVLPTPPLPGHDDADALVDDRSRRGVGVRVMSRAPPAGTGAPIADASMYGRPRPRASPRCAGG